THPDRLVDLGPVRGDDSRGLLSPVLEGVEPQVDEVRRLGMAIDPEDPALVVEAAPHRALLAGAPLYPGPSPGASRPTPRARSSPRLHASCRRATGTSKASSPSIPTTRALPRTRPITVAGAPSSSAMPRTVSTSSGTPEGRLREALSPKRRASWRTGVSHSSGQPQPLRSISAPTGVSPAMQHSASATASPPSAQSWAEWRTPASIARRAAD